MFISIILVLCSIVNFGTPCCEEKERISNYLDTAVDLITKAKLVNITCPNDDNFRNQRAYDCSDLLRSGYNKSGVYTIWPLNRLTSIKGLRVYCDMDNGGWTVIQRRGDFGRANDYFFKDWKNYKNGFGDIEKDFWLGNDNIFALTNQRPYSVYFDLEDKTKDRAYAHYDNFWIDDEFNNYTLHISGYRGTAGDGMHFSDTMKFSTIDRDNDKWSGNCALDEKSGWWFKNCANANLNGVYKNNVMNVTRGNNWYPWKNSREYLPRTEIKIKSSIF